MRRAFFIFAYPFLWFLSLLIALYVTGLKLDFMTLGATYAALFISRLFLMNAFHLFDVSWRFVSIGEVFDLGFALFLAEIPPLLLLYLLNVPLITRFLVVEFLFSITFSEILLSAKRVFLTFLSDAHRMAGRKKAVLVGDTARVEKFLRTVEDPSSAVFIDGIIATDEARKGDFIRGIRIIGTAHDLFHIVRNKLYDTVYVIGDSLDGNKLRELIRECERENVRLRVVSVDISFKNSSIFTVRNIDTEDLLFRREVKIDPELIEKFVNQKCILITGAAGSIGSELAYQVARFMPLKLLLLDIDETNVFLLFEKLMKQFPYLEIDYYVADVTNERKMEQIFRNESIDVVFHAAAYKHVPVMEKFPDEAIRVNVIGTYIVSRESALSRVERFVLISTDKAVKPASVMGATKRLAEKMTICMAKRYRDTSFLAVRFGNVLGSRGSVIPVFNEQIRQGGPVTITHPDMERYFMTTREAVLLVLEAGAVGRSGEIYVLDMGKPVKIVDLARELIRLHGLEPDVDIPIRFVGKRPGEKLTEELYAEEENIVETEYEKLLRLKPNGLYDFDCDAFVRRIKEELAKSDIERLKKMIFDSI